MDSYDGRGGEGREEGGSRRIEVWIVEKREEEGKEDGERRRKEICKVKYG